MGEEVLRRGQIPSCSNHSCESRNPSLGRRRGDAHPHPFASFDRLRTNGVTPYRNRSDAASLMRGPVPDSSDGV